MAADFEVHLDNEKKWYWIFQAENNKKIARSSESYDKREDCLHSIKVIKDLCVASSVFDMTNKVAGPKIVSQLP